MDHATQVVTQGTLRTREGRALPLERTEVDAVVTGAVADVTVRQVFRNDGAEPIEAVYFFPLPHEASVYRMQFRIADRVVKAVVKEKAEARKVYEKARSEGRAATLLEEDRPSLFTLSVANVAPGVTIEVELAYQEVLAYDDGRWRFVFPMVAPERYREASGEAPAALAPPRVPTGERPPDVAVRVTVRGDGAVEELRCTSHRTTTASADDGAQVVTLDAGTSVANRDFVLTWRAGDTGVRPYVRFDRAKGQRGTFLLLLTPSIPRDGTERQGGRDSLKAVRCGNCGGVVSDLSAIKEIPGLGPVFPCGFCGAILMPGTEVVTRATRPRDVLIVVDRSASMRGTGSLVTRAVSAVLAALAPGDGVQVIVFDHECKGLLGNGTGFVMLSPEAVAAVERALPTYAPRGGTELEAALEQAAKVSVREGRTRSVVLVTDASVGNEGRLLRKAPELMGANTRLFVLGVGAVVDRRLVEKLARACGGASDVIVRGESGDDTLARFARRVREGGPVLSGLTLYWEGAAIADVYPPRLPDLYGGEPLRVLGRYDNAGSSKLVITGATAEGRPFRQELAVTLPEFTALSSGLARLWARRRVEDLASRADAGASDATALRAEGTALSLEHGIVGPFTSLVADDSEVSVESPAKQKKKVWSATATAGESDGEAIEAPRMEEGAAAHEMVSPRGYDEDAIRKGAVDPFADAAALADDEAPTRGAFTGARSRAAAPMAFGGMPPLGAAPPAPGGMPPLGAAPPRPGGPPPAASPMIGGMPVRAAVPMMPAPAPMMPVLGPMPSMASPARPRSVSTGAPPQQAQAPTTPVSLDLPGSEAYTQDERAWFSKRNRGELDLVFLVDETGSMGPYIAQVRDHLMNLVTAVKASPLCRSLRIGIVTYRDHPPQDHTYASRVVPLTDDVDSIYAEVGRLTAAGGGDGPESVTDGLFDVVRLGWRAQAARAVVWFGDAPPHGVEPVGDAFPQGCPCGHHWFTQAESCREMGVAIYAIGCLPGLRGFVGAEAVFRQVASTTRGLFLPLRDAGLLVPLIAGAASAELDRQRIDERVADLVQSNRETLAKTTETERVRWVTEALQRQGVRVRGMDFDPNSPAPAPLRFRDVMANDVEGALDRLRFMGRVEV